MRALTEFPTEDIALYFRGAYVRLLEDNSIGIMGSVEVDEEYDEDESDYRLRFYSRVIAVEGRRGSMRTCELSDLAQYWPRVGIRNYLDPNTNTIHAVRVMNTARRVSRRSTCPDTLTIRSVANRQEVATSRYLRILNAIERFPLGGNVTRVTLDNSSYNIESVGIGGGVALVKNEENRRYDVYATSSLVRAGHIDMAVDRPLYVRGVAPKRVASRAEQYVRRFLYEGA